MLGWQVMHQLCRADYVNVKYELIQLQGQVSRVPELSLASFPQLGTLLKTCPPVDLTDPTADYGWVIGHHKCFKGLYHSVPCYPSCRYYYETLVIRTSFKFCTIIRVFHVFESKVLVHLRV